MTNIKSEIYSNLVTKGRELVVDKGASFLTARKLSEASGYSVGTIYNQFLNMDNFIIVQNMLTLDSLYDVLTKVQLVENAHENINKYLDAFNAFVVKNANLWFLLYEFHLRQHNEKLPCDYTRKIVKVTKKVFADFSKINEKISFLEQKMFRKVLAMSVFSLSPYLTNDLFEGFNEVKKETVCKLLLNTYLAGVTTLGKEG